MIVRDILDLPIHSLLQLNDQVRYEDQ